MGLTNFQKVYFWAGALLPIPSIALYVLVPGGTIEHFGGTVTPTAKFWCSIASSGDAMFSTLCFCVLRNPNNDDLKRTVLLANAVYSLFHFGGFLRGHLTIEKHPGGPAQYVFGILSTWAFYLAWGRKPKQIGGSEGYLDIGNDERSDPTGTEKS